MESGMSSTQAQSATTFKAVPSAQPAEMKLEVIVIPVADVDRAKRFYANLGWRLDLDVSADPQYRVVQFTPPGSSCSIIFGRGVSAAAPGSAQGLHLIVSDLVAVRAQLQAHGVEVSEPFYDAGGLFHHADPREVTQGLQPQRNSYGSYASFRDPDGNTWVFQEVTVRLAGDVNGGPLTSVGALQASFRRAKAAAEGNGKTLSS
jgi:catechol 2,3-dioxygenase-like lactoylglutathione lyase family enzyme